MKLNNVVGRILESNISVKSKDCVEYKYPPYRSCEERTVSYHFPKSVGAAATRRVLAMLVKCSGLGEYVCLSFVKFHQI